LFFPVIPRESVITSPPGLFPHSLTALLTRVTARVPPLSTVATPKPLSKLQGDPAPAPTPPNRRLSHDRELKHPPLVPNRFAAFKSHFFWGGDALLECTTATAPCLLSRFRCGSLSRFVLPPFSKGLAPNKYIWLFPFKIRRGRFCFFLAVRAGCPPTPFDFPLPLPACFSARSRLNRDVFVFDGSCCFLCVLG